MTTAAPNLQALPRGLAAKAPGPCVITIRQHMTNLNWFEGPAV